jgi:thioredoxin 1
MKSSLLFSFLFPVMALFVAADYKPVNHAAPENNIAVINDTKGGTIEFTDANFHNKVLSSDKLTLVDFWATWCGPCRTMGPVVEDLAKEYSGKVNIGKLDVDNNPNVCGKYGITSIPTILFIKNGKVVDRTVGVYPRSKLVKMIKAHM